MTNNDYLNYFASTRTATTALRERNAEVVATPVLSAYQQGRVDEAAWVATVVQERTTEPMRVRVVQDESTSMVTRVIKAVLR